MPPEPIWLIVIPATYEATEARITEVMKPSLKARFPNHEFIFCRGEDLQELEGAPEPWDRPTVIPMIGTAGDLDSPGTIQDRPPLDLQQEVQDYVDFLDIAALLGRP